MRIQSYLSGAASLVVSAGLIVLPGCSSFGSRVANWSSPNKRDTAPVTLGKIQSDNIGRPVPGSQAPPPPALEAPSQQAPSGTRSHVAIAMGEMLERGDNLTGARDQFEQALKLEPKSLKAALALARVEARLGRPDAALRIYQNAEKQHRRSSAVFNDKGLLLAEQKDWNGAIVALRTAIKLEPSESRYHNNLGMVLASSGSYDDAWREFREAVGPGPAHYNIALMHLQAGHNVEARNHLERSLAAMPNLKEAHDLLAQLDAESPGGSLAGTEPDVNMELENVGQLAKYETTSNVTDDQHIVPAATSEQAMSEPAGESKPAVELEPGVESKPVILSKPAAKTNPPVDPWSKRWVPPKWLR